MKIRILPEAVHDLELGADFYETQREELGTYFNNSLMSDIESLRLYAGVHQRQYGLYCCLSRRFPFAIYYDVTNAAIEIYAVLDCRQDPATIKTKLESR